MADLNDVKLFGRVVKDSELTTTSSGNKYLKFSIAVNHVRKDKESDKYVNEADFFPLVIYGEYAEKMQKFLVKGQRIIVQAYLKQDKWEKDGVKKSAISIGVKNIQIIFDSKKDNDAENFAASDEEIIVDSEPTEDEIYIDFEENDGLF